MFAWLALLMGLILPSEVVRAASILANPGAEAGNLSGWNSVFSVLAVSTNAHYYNNNTPAGASNVLTHSGGWIFQTYNSFAGGAPTLLYQDVAAAAGSVWSASIWGISHWQDYIAQGNVAYLEIMFLDSQTNALAVYGSVVLDPSGFSGVIPPMGTNASDFMFLPANLVYNHVSAPGFPLSSADVIGSAATYAAPVGTVRVRYQIEYDGIAFQGGSIFWDDADLEKISGSDPDITSAPVAQSIVVGQTAHFTVVGSGNTALSYQWMKGASLLANGGRISGATSASLTISNCFLTDSGSYSVVVTDTAGSITSIPVSLTVLDPAAAANSLGNHGFESGVWNPWLTFNGVALATTNDTYIGNGQPVNVFDGNYVGQVFDSGQYDGFFQDISITPGTVWKADGWGYTSSADPLTNSSVCWIEVSFRDGTGGNILSIYKSSVLESNSTQDAWINLPVTNLYDNINYSTNLGSTGLYMTAPTNAHSIRYQVTFRSLDYGSGSVYWDDMTLYQIIPVTVKATPGGANINISFPTRGGSTYAVLYKTNLSNPNWQLLTTVTGDGTVRTVLDPATGSAKFYRVQTQ